MEPFDLLPYWDDRALNRVLPPEKGRAAYVELHNLIAAAGSPREFGPEDLTRIGRQHGVDLRRAFLERRQALYGRYLNHCLTNGDLSEPERDTLAHLARTLALTPAAVLPIHERAFGQTVSAALSDDCLELQERLLLYKLQHTLGLDPDEANQTYEWMAREKLLTRIAGALCDGELSPDEAKAIEDLEHQLAVQVPERVEVMLDQAAQRWKLRHGSLPSIDVGVTLLPGELGHFSTAVRWQEVNYARLRVLLSSHRELLHEGKTASLRIPARAFVGRKPEEGRVVVTNKRLVLLRNQSEPVKYGLVSLVDVELYANGMRVSVKGDRTFVLNAGPDTKTLYSVLYRVLHPGREVPPGA